MIRLMRDGVAVPHLAPVDRVDLMVEVLSDMSLHHAVADGNIKTGLRVSFDNSSQDHLIVREAATFWKELSMRQKMRKTNGRRSVASPPHPAVETQPDRQPRRRHLPHVVPSPAAPSATPIASAGRVNH